ncbi:MAG: glycosyltransferase [Planctomycetota bacterium]|nr:glycosyltransferase [Planctomycetota bacterium]
MFKSTASRLKILSMGSWYSTKEDPFSGIFIREYVKASLLYNDVLFLHYNEVAKTVHNNFYEFTDEMDEGIRTIRLYYRRLPLPLSTFLLQLWSIFRVFRKLLKEGLKPDIIHIQYSLAGIPAILLGWLYQIPVITTDHSTRFIGYAFLSTKFEGRPVFTAQEKRILRFVMNRVKLVLPVSHLMVRNIKALGIHNKFAVIPNVVNTAVFQPVPLSREVPAIKKLLLVGFLRPQKGIPYLLEALHRLSNKRTDFMLDIVGDGPDLQEYEDLTQKLGLAKWVRFHGLKSKQEVARFMQECQFYVLPSLWETFGVVLIEALSCGKPIISTRIEGPDEILNDKVCRWVPPADVQALTEAIDYMLDHYQDYEPEELAQYARERFSYEAVGQKLTEIYQQVRKVQI